VYYDKRHRKYNVEDYVLIRDTTHKPSRDKKLKSNYKGPYQVTKVLNNNRFVVQDQVLILPLDHIIQFYLQTV